MFTKRFRCCSHKCLYGEAGAAALIIRFKSARVMARPAGVKSHQSQEKHFSILFDNSFIELQGSNLKIWEKQGLF